MDVHDFVQINGICFVWLNPDCVSKMRVKNLETFTTKDRQKTDKRKLTLSYET